MTEIAHIEEKARVTVETQEAIPRTLFSLPFLGETTVEDVTFYGVLGAVTVLELVAWPTAALIGSAHALHQRARHIAGTRRSQVFEGVLEATEEMF
jgi:hypothetical protein